VEAYLAARDKSKIAIIGPSFFGYVEAVTDELRCQGYPARYFDERHSNSIYSKILYRLGFDYPIRRARKEHLSLLITYIMDGGFGSVLLVDVEVIDRVFCETLQSRGVDVFLYMWDSAKNKPGFVDMIGTVKAAATFDPWDAENLGMYYIPLFAETVYKPTANDPVRAVGSIGFNGTMHSHRARQLVLLERILDGSSHVEKLLYYHSKILYFIKSIFSPSSWRYIFDISTTGDPKKIVAELYKRSEYVIDIHHPGQSGLTSRTFEALRAGALLITFNKTVSSLPPSLAARCAYIETVEEAPSALARLTGLPSITEDEDYFLSLERFVSNVVAFMALPAKQTIAGSH
jgi:hypothetical protein